MAEAAAALGNSLDMPSLSYRRCESELVVQMLATFGYADKRARYLVNIFDAFNAGLLGPEHPRDESSCTPTTIEAFAVERVRSPLPGVLAIALW